MSDITDFVELCPNLVKNLVGRSIVTGKLILKATLCIQCAESSLLQEPILHIK